MRAVSVLIVEDKAVIAENLKVSLEKAGYIVAGSVTSGEEAITVIRQSVPDIILMDIQLSGKMDGIQTMEAIKPMSDIPVIYLTDFSDSATVNRAKYTRPSAYIPKPFQTRDVLIAVEIAFSNASENISALPGENKVTGRTHFPMKDRIFIKDRETMFRVDIKDILWVEADGAYCRITTETRTITLVCTLKSFHEKIDNPLLVRVHRSFAVNIDKVTAIKGNLLIIGTTEIPISAAHRDEIHQKFSIL